RSANPNERRGFLDSRGWRTEILNSKDVFCWLQTLQSSLSMSFAVLSPEPLHPALTPHDTLLQGENVSDPQGHFKPPKQRAPSGDVQGSCGAVEGGAIGIYAIHANWQNGR